MSLLQSLNIPAGDITVTRKTSVNDGYGGQTFTTTTTNLGACALWPLTQRTALQSGRESRVATHQLSTARGLYTFNANDLYITYSGNQYDIVGPNLDVAVRGPLLLIDVELIK